MKAQLRALVNRFPRLKGLLKRARQWMVPRREVPANYVVLEGTEIESEAARLRSAWKDGGLPTRQRDLVDRQLAEYRRGGTVDVFDVMVKSLRQVLPDAVPVRVLEIGCSSGYYAEVFAIVGLDVAYTGCDYSESFVAMARERYPHLPFDVQDATALQYPDKSFDVVISGCCVPHIPEYEKAIIETARVAERYAIFHKTPVVVGQPSKQYRKQAYDVEMVEIHLNEPEFLGLLAHNGLELLATHTLDETVSHGVGSATRTYVCRKKAA